MQPWQWFLVIVLGVVFGVVIAVAIVIAVIKRKMSKFFSELKSSLAAFGAPVIPQTIELSPIENWSGMTPEIQSGIDELKSLGFEIGSPMDAGMHGVVIIPFADTSRYLSGALMVSKMGVHVDVVSIYEDGRMVTHGTLPDQGFERHEATKMVRMPGAGVTELTKRHLQERPEGPLVPIALADVPAEIKRTIEDEYHWRASRGGLTEAEWSRHFAITSPASTDDEERSKEITAARDMVKAVVRGQAVQYIETKAAEQFLKETTMSVAEWDDVRDRCLYLHAYADADCLAHFFVPRDFSQSSTDDNEPSEYDVEREKVRDELKEGPFLEVFRRLNEGLPEEARLVKLTDLMLRGRRADIPVEVWLTPKED